MNRRALGNLIGPQSGSLRRTRDFAQVLVDAVERLILGSRGPGSGSLRLAYEVLDCADATIEDWQGTHRVRGIWNGVIH